MAARKIALLYMIGTRSFVRKAGSQVGRKVGCMGLVGVKGRKLKAKSLNTALIEAIESP